MVEAELGLETPGVVWNVDSGSGWNGNGVGMRFGMRRTGGFALVLVGSASCSAGGGNQQGGKGGKQQICSPWVGEFLG